MKISNTKESVVRAVIMILLFFGAVVASAVVYAHGGKSHGAGGEFTNLEALKKATELYDKLVASNKLDVSWEISVEAIQIAERRKGSEVEKVVSFSKKTGDPRTVYIFFTSHGEYAGSNLTGQ